MKHFKMADNVLTYLESGMADADVQVIWGHGWGQSHKALLPLAESLPNYHHYLVDFQGFGASPPPPENWQTADYAHAIHTWVESLPKAKTRIFVGHSFGGRVALQLGANYPSVFDGLFIVAGAGIPRQKSLLKKLIIKIKISAYKILKKLAQLKLISCPWLENTFGSADYKNAGAMRPIFLQVIRENLAPQAQKIACPVFLLYGKNDTETPPDIGQKLEKLIKQVQLVIADGEDHYSILAEGRHQTVFLLKKFIESIHP